MSIYMLIYMNIRYLFNDYVSFTDIRRSNRPFLEDKTEDDFFQIDVRFLNFFFFLIVP